MGDTVEYSAINHHIHPWPHFHPSTMTICNTHVHCLLILKCIVIVMLGFLLLSVFPLSAWAIVLTATIYSYNCYFSYIFIVTVTLITTFGVLLFLLLQPSYYIAITTITVGANKFRCFVLVLSLLLLSLFLLVGVVIIIASWLLSKTLLLVPFHICLVNSSSLWHFPTSRAFGKYLVLSSYIPKTSVPAQNHPSTMDKKEVVTNNRISKNKTGETNRIYAVGLLQMSKYKSSWRCLKCKSFRGTFEEYRVQLNSCIVG